MTEPKNDQPSPKPRRLTRALLIGSLALNVLIIGVVGGAVFSLRGGSDKGPVSDRFGSPHIKALTFDDKREVGRAIRSTYRKSNVDHRADHQHYKEALAVLRTSPLDEAVLRNLVMTLDQAGERRRAMARDVFLAKILSMSDAERADYADRLEEVLARGPKDKKHPPKDGKPRPPKQP
ncbi:periplasmic heavy metal sensor [uncultured Shimia sp.]|uniref:periplasmic heavy metal sensor n=1 Tax=uncultured Shimia sp. TaxID=573152 RepID=UPI00260EFEE9|nr:periplasmic heavy metal sensor [uncultured Shimia sp.]